MKATILSLVVGLMLSVNAMASISNCPLANANKNMLRGDNKGNAALSMNHQPQAQNIDELRSDDSRTN